MCNALSPSGDLHLLGNRALPLGSDYDGSFGVRRGVQPSDNVAQFLVAGPIVLEKGDRSRKAAGQVPQPDRAVSGAGEQQFGAGALVEGDVVDAVAMPCQLDE